METYRLVDSGSSGQVLHPIGASARLVGHPETHREVADSRDW